MTHQSQYFRQPYQLQVKQAARHGLDWARPGLDYLGPTCIGPTMLASWVPIVLSYRSKPDLRVWLMRAIPTQQPRARWVGPPISSLNKEKILKSATID
jgi:hypothetical protein